MNGVILAACVIGVLGLLIALLLGFAAIKLAVPVDEKEIAVREYLPGNNCGGCGYAGCSGLAAAIVKGDAPVNGCPVGGAPVAAKVGEIMGVAAEEGKKQVAFVKCAGTCEKAGHDYEYTGVEDCAAIHFPHALQTSLSTFAIPSTTCIAACPKHLIELVPYEAKHLVQCSSKDKGKDVMKACSVGCIGCHLCEKNCPNDAVHVVDNVAYIDQEKCTGCGICAEKCPKKIIL